MYKLTEKAVNDFRGIYDYTLMRFSEKQADLYTDALEKFFQTLSEMPDIGLDYDTVPGVKQISFQSHMVFYAVRYCPHTASADGPSPPSGNYMRRAWQA